MPQPSIDVADIILMNERRAGRTLGAPGIGREQQNIAGLRT
jgi:hypothetical protein